MPACMAFHAGQPDAQDRKCRENERELADSPTCLRKLAPMPRRGRVINVRSPTTPAGVEGTCGRITGGRSLRSDHRLPYESPPATCEGHYSCRRPMSSAKKIARISWSV